MTDLSNKLAFATGGPPSNQRFVFLFPREGAVNTAVAHQDLPFPSFLYLPRTCLQLLSALFLKLAPLAFLGGFPRVTRAAHAVWRTGRAWKLHQDDP